MEQVRAGLEERQVAIYPAALAIEVLAGFALPNAGALEATITPALAVMLFATFLQVPLAELHRRCATRAFLPRCLRPTSSSCRC